MATTRQNIAAQLNFVALEPDEPYSQGVMHELMTKTPLATARGNPHKDLDISKYIGVFFDPRFTGEAQSKPQHRVPPLRADLYRRLMDFALARLHGENTSAALPHGDLYFLFDGGKQNQADLLRPFQGKTKLVKNFYITKDEESLTKRLQRVKGGIGAYNQVENMYLVCNKPLAVKVKNFQSYGGSTQGNSIGTVVLQPTSAMWQLTWGQKKELFTPAHIIPVGGRTEDEDDTEQAPYQKAKPRDALALEPVFWHALPAAFYDELLGAFSLSHIFDLTCGDGALALSAYRRSIPYTGITLGDAHTRFVSKHVTSQIWNAMSTAEDPLYDPRLVATLKADEPKTLATTKSKANAHTRENQKTPKPESPKSTDVDAQPKATKGAKRKAQAPPAEDQDTAAAADAEVDEEDEGAESEGLSHGE